MTGSQYSFTSILLRFCILLCMLPVTAKAQLFGGMIKTKKKPVIIIPAAITLGQNANYFIASAYDTDYLPYTAPTAPATTSTQAADGAPDRAVNLQGVITTTGIVVSIPVIATASGTLPAYFSTVTVPASLTEDGISRDLTLSWSSQGYTTATKSLRTTLKAVGGTLNVKKLDINAGLGNDNLGVLLAQLSYPYNSVGATTTCSVRNFPGIPDKMFGLPDNGGLVRHNFLYFPIQGEDGKTWLGNNLGADYANVNSGSFYLGRWAMSHKDYHAYGSLFQWGRKPDGHELMNWGSDLYGTVVNGTSTTKSDIPADALFIINLPLPYGQWRVNINDAQWACEPSTNNPCPAGFRVPTDDELSNLIHDAGISDYLSAFASKLHLPSSGYREGNNGALWGASNYIIYWTSSADPTYPGYSHYLRSYPPFGLTVAQRNDGASVRCLRDESIAGTISSLNCSPTNAGTLMEGTVASGVTSTISYTGGNAGVYSPQSIASTGVTGLTATLLDANYFSTSTGTLTYTITGTPVGNGTASFAVNIGGQTCSLTRTVSPYTIPATITLAQNTNYFVASVYDTDYLPYSAPTGLATATTQAADGVADPTINVQGVITTTGITVSIPVTATASGTLPAYFNFSTVTIPASLTEDGISRDLKLSWVPQAYTTATTYITATLQAVGGTLNVKKLDINAGIGNDYLGVLLGQLMYPYNNAGATTACSVRDVSGVPDKMFELADNGGVVRHNFLYTPVQGEDGKIWLNNNLGADYANVNNASFNPGQQATAYNDYHAYGSLFQWGRKPDGHELITWSNSTAGTTVNTSTTTLSNTPNNAMFITSLTAPFDWLVNQDNTLWTYATSTNNPCPSGFRVATDAEITALVTTAKITNYTTAASSNLHFSVPGNRFYNSGLLYDAGGYGYYWSSSVSGNSAIDLNFSTSYKGSYAAFRMYGMSVRCLRDESPAGAISSLDCAGATHAGTLTQNTATSGVTSTISYTGGNAGVYSPQSIASTGVTGLTATLNANYFSAGTGTLTYTITGTPVDNGTASFTINIGGQACSLTRTVTPPTIPPTITLTQNTKFFVASVYDTDYLPYSAPTAVASTSTQIANNVADPVVNVQGAITTTGVTISIPATATGSGTMLAYSSTVNIPASLTEDGISRNLKLSWASQGYTTATTSITATLQAVGGTLNAKRLDINAGIGNDYLGVLLGQLMYPYNNAGATTAYSVRDISGIPDKMFNLFDNGGMVRHKFLYVPVQGEDGKIWLNNNLGADYANLSSASFNLTQQATAYNDYHAYGSLFQWGRKPDGHELISWTNSSTGTPANTTTTTLSDTPNNAKFITTSTEPIDWRVTSNNTLWATAASTNNPCPSGFRVSTDGETTALVTAAAITNYATGASSNLHLSVPGYNTSSTGVLAGAGSYGYYWSSSVSDNRAIDQNFGSSYTAKGTDCRAVGSSVRCIRDESPAGAISSLNCSPTNTGTLQESQAASGVTSTISYTGGNAGVYSPQSIASTGVTGLTATLDANYFSTGAGTLTYKITGTPVGIGWANFAINISGRTCTLQLLVHPATIPTTITLGQNTKYFVASVYDTDYLPYSAPTAVASTSTQAANGVADPVVNVQGAITTTGVTISIPATVTSNGQVQSYSNTVNIPASLTEDGISRDLKLSWVTQDCTTDTKSITATLQAVGGTLNIKKLDIDAGIGNDYLGVLLGQFVYPYNNVGATTTYSVRDIAGIPDRMFGLADNGGGVRHNFLYLPVQGEDGRIWLNNNLGADYANVSSASFNLAKQATAYNDYHAYGSLFQWGRKPDGHELISWTNSSTGTGVNTFTSTRSDAPNDAYFITTPIGTFDWRVISNYRLWTDLYPDSNPCPIGYKLPSALEQSTLFSLSAYGNDVSRAQSRLKITNAGHREDQFDFNGAVRYAGYCSQYWTNTSAYGWGATSWYGRGTVNEQTPNNGHQATGLSVRCIGN